YLGLLTKLEIGTEEAVTRARPQDWLARWIQLVHDLLILGTRWQNAALLLHEKGLRQQKLTLRHLRLIARPLSKLRQEWPRFAPFSRQEIPLKHQVLDSNIKPPR